MRLSFMPGLDCGWDQVWHYGQPFGSSKVALQERQALTDAVDGRNPSREFLEDRCSGAKLYTRDFFTGRRHPDFKMEKDRARSAPMSGAGTQHVGWGSPGLLALRFLLPSNMAILFCEVAPIKIGRRNMSQIPSCELEG